MSRLIDKLLASQAVEPRRAILLEMVVGREVSVAEFIAWAARNGVLNEQEQSAYRTLVAARGRLAEQARANHELMTEVGL